MTHVWLEFQSGAVVKFFSHVSDCVGSLSETESSLMVSDRSSGDLQTEKKKVRHAGGNSDTAIG